MLPQSLLGLDKLFRLGGNFLAHCSWPRYLRCIYVALAIVALVLTGCTTSSSSSTEHTGQRERSQTAMDMAIALLQTKENFYAALKDRNVQGMIDAATTRNGVPFSALADLETKTAVRAITISMLKQARSLALGNQLLSERIDKELERLNKKNNPRLFSSGLFSMKKLMQGDTFVRTLNLQGNSTLTVELGSDATLGTIVYVEHPLNERIVLRVLNQQGKHLCSQQNPRGHIICRYKNKIAEKLTATVTNLGPMPTSVLFIRNQ